MSGVPVLFPFHGPLAFAWPSVAFGRPEVLLFLLLLVLFVLFAARRSLSGISRMRHRTAMGLRITAVVLVVLALADTRMLRRDDRLSVIFVVDVSDSVPYSEQAKFRELISNEQRKCDFGRGDQIGVVVFGEDAGIEVSPRSQEFALGDFATLVNKRATNIQTAVRLAVAAFPGEVGGKRLVLVSDGGENVGDALDEVRSARALGVTTDVIPISYARPREIRVDSVQIEPYLRESEPFDLRVIVSANLDEGQAHADVRVHLFENGIPLPLENSVRRIETGKNVLQFRSMRREQPGTYEYTVQIEPLRGEDDSVVENNRAGALALITGKPRVLLCTSDPDLDAPLVAALKSERVAVDVVTPAKLPRKGTGYLDYSALIFSNVGADQLGEDRMNLVEGLVKAVGIGCVMVGGENSFGAGGYEGSPMERLLPVDMDIEHKKVLPNGALAMVVHSCELGNGNWWAKQVVQHAIRVLSPRDYAGVIYHDNQAREQWLFPMTPCTERRYMLSQLRSFNPGDMLSFEIILRMGLEALNSTPASIKHIIILSDGDPSAPSQRLVDEIKAGRITISTICYGAHGSIPPEIRWLAKEGGGNFYYLKSPRDLPQLVIREATTVRKTLISQDSFVPVVAGGGPVLQGLPQDQPLPILSGYVLTTAKPLAAVPLVHPPSTDDPSTDPVLATWSYGLGKSAAFTSDAGRLWGKAWTSWQGYRRFWVQLVRFVSRRRFEESFQVSRELRGDRARVYFDLFELDGGYRTDLEPEARVVSPGPEHATIDASARQVGPGRVLVEFSAKTAGTYAVSLRPDREGDAGIVAGLTVPYSLEHRGAPTDHERLRRLAEAGGGRYVEEGVDFFSRDFPAAYASREIWRALLLLALVAFFTDIVTRRVVVDVVGIARRLRGAMGSLWSPRRPRREEADERLSVLLDRKAAVRRQTDARSQTLPAERARGDPEEARALGTTDGTVGEERTPSSKPLQTGRAPESPPRTPEADGEDDESFTRRLLDAKKRALRRKDGDAR